MTSVSGTAAPSANQLNANQGSATAALAAADFPAPVQNRRRSSTSTAAMTSRSRRISASRPRTTPSATGRRSRTNTSSQMTATAPSPTSSPIEDTSSGLTVSRPIASGANHAGSPARSPALLSPSARSTWHSTKSAPAAKTASRRTTVSAASASTFSGDVAVFDVPCSISPQCPWNARFLA
jgi:hypothetical protein